MFGVADECASRTEGRPVEIRTVVDTLVVDDRRGGSRHAEVVELHADRIRVGGPLVVPTEDDAAVSGLRDRRVDHRDLLHAVDQ